EARRRRRLVLLVSASTDARSLLLGTNLRSLAIRQLHESTRLQPGRYSKRSWRESRQCAARPPGLSGNGQFARSNLRGGTPALAASLVAHDLQEHRPVSRPRRQPLHSPCIWSLHFEQ